MAPTDPPHPNPPSADDSDSADLAYELPDEQRPASASPTEGQLERELPGTDPSAGHDAYAAWRYPGFRLFIIGWLCTLVGGQMQASAIAWEIYQHTRRAMDLGWLGLAQAIPVIVLALPAGHVADRFRRVNVVIVGQSVAVACSAALAVISFAVSRQSSPFWLLYVPMVLTAVGLTFSRAARSALLPSLVPAAVFPNAVTWNSSVFETSSLAGAALSGPVLALSTRWIGGVALTYVLAAVLNGVYVALLFVLAAKYARATPAGPRKPADLRDLTEGVRYVWQTKVVLAAITLDLFAVLFGGATFLLPIFAERLGVKEVGYGILRAAPAVGAFSMAIWLAHRPPMRQAGRTLLWAVAGFGAATIVFGLSNSFGLSLAMLVLTGMFDNVSVVIRHTLVQVMTPDAMRGRVSAVNNVFIGASNELGGWESGLTAAWFGAVASVVGGGIGTIVVVAAAAALWPQLRRFGSLQDANP